MTLHNQVHVSARIALALALPLAGLVGLAPPVAALPSGHSVGEDVAKTLAPTTSLVGKADVSTNSMAINAGPNPQPLAYRTDRLVLRAKFPGVARDLVQDVVDHSTDDAIVEIFKVINLPDLPGTAGTRVPIVVVSFSPVSKNFPILWVAREVRKRGLRASPDYLLSPTSGPSGMWPEGYPVKAGALDTARVPTVGAGVTVTLFDVGLPPAVKATLPPNVSKLSETDTEVVDAKVNGTADHYYSGHSVAIASTIATVAPGATVQAARITDEAGIATDSSAAERMAAVLCAADGQGGQWPDLIVGAFGSPASDVDPLQQSSPELEPLGLKAVVESINDHAGTLFVAAAGNRSMDRKFYPAAFDGVKAVGALDAYDETEPGDSRWTSADGAGERAEFSNYGDWIDAWAPGTDLIVNHLTGIKFAEGEDPLYGVAYVSGTSFAAPYVVARIAEQMVSGEQKTTPEAAWDALNGDGAVRCTLNGGGVALTLTSMEGAVPPTPGGERGC